MANCDRSQNPLSQLKIQVILTVLLLPAACKPGVSNSTLAVAGSSENQAISKYCKASNSGLKRQMTVQIDKNTTMIIHNRDVCTTQKMPVKSLALVKPAIPAKTQVVILRYGTADDLKIFRNVEPLLAKNGYEPIVIENRSGDALRTELERLKNTHPGLVTNDLRTIIQGHGGISSADQQHVIGDKFVKTAEEVIAPLEVLTGPGRKCSVLVDSCYSGQVVHDVEAPTKPNKFLGTDGKVGVASSSTSFRPDYADNGTVLNTMLSMSSPDSTDRQAADTNKDGGVSLDEASTYINGKGGVYHDAHKDGVITDKYNLNAVSWIEPKDFNDTDPEIANRLKYNNDSSRTEIDSASQNKAAQTLSSSSKLTSEMFVGGNKEATDMLLFPTPIKDVEATTFGDSVKPVTPAINPDQRQ